MAQTVQIEHTVTIMNGKLLAFESDVRVTASVCNDGEVLIQNIEMTGVVPRVRSMESFALDRVIEPMTDSSDPHMVRLAMWAAEILMADDEFVFKAQTKAGLVYVGQGGNDPDGYLKQTEAA